MAPADVVITGEPTQKYDILETLYKAVSEGDMVKVAGLMAGDLEWWFHGPPRCHHMMNALTSRDVIDSVGFRFEPRRLTEISEWVVVAEGWEGDAYWVHVWTLNKAGLITHFREYFNTWLTVRDTSQPPAVVVSATIWESQPRDLFRRSLPGLLLAI